MRKLIREVNDQEICRRLEILMNTEKEDLPSATVRRMLEQPLDFDPREVPEPFTQYVKHYLYMIKRESREKEREREKIIEAKPRSSKKLTKVIKQAKATGQ